MLLCKFFRDAIVHSVFVVLFIIPYVDVVQSANSYNYTYALGALTDGTMVQNASSTPGAMWLNVRGYAPNALPFIQNNLGVHSLDAYDELRMVASLAIMAAKYKLYGDLVYLYSLFQMNAAFGSSNVNKTTMRQALWKGVTGCASFVDCGAEGDIVVSPFLLDLYASTSTSSRLSRVYEDFKMWNATTPRSRLNDQQVLGDDCNSTLSHATSQMTCSGLITLLKDGRMSPKYGGPRSVCYASCCISWTGNAVFQWSDVLPDINEYCLENPTPGTTIQEVGANISQGTNGPPAKRKPRRQVSCSLQALVANGQQFNVCMGNSAMNCA